MKPASGRRSSLPCRIILIKAVNCACVYFFNIRSSKSVNKVSVAGLL
jgi:hypothetical protein